MTVTFGCAEARAGGRAGRRRWPARSSWSTSGCGRGCAARPALRVHRRGRRRRLVAAARPGVGEVHPGRGRAWRPARRPTPARRVLSVGGALAGPTGMVRYAGSARAEVLRQHPSVIATGRVADAGRVQAWVCGSGLGTGDDAAGRAARRAGRPGAGGARRRRADPAGRRLARRPAARPGRARSWSPRTTGEFARLCGEEPGADRVGAALRLAAWMNAVVLLKGDRTVDRHAGRPGVGQPDRHPGAGHRRHRRRAGRAARLAAGGRAAGRSGRRSRPRTCTGWPAGRRPGAAR